MDSTGVVRLGIQTFCSERVGVRVLGKFSHYSGPELWSQGWVMRCLLAKIDRSWLFLGWGRQCVVLENLEI